MTDLIRYVCEECSTKTYGESWDVQEAPRLWCSGCGEKLHLEVVRRGVRLRR